MWPTAAKFPEVNVSLITAAEGSETAARCNFPGTKMASASRRLKTEEARWAACAVNFGWWDGCAECRICRPAFIFFHCDVIFTFREHVRSSQKTGNNVRSDSHFAGEGIFLFFKRGTYLSSRATPAIGPKAELSAFSLVGGVGEKNRPEALRQADS